MSDDLKPGEWVAAFGQLVDRPNHPDDVVVQFFSHNEQYDCHIKRDRVAVVDPPDFALTCNSLYRNDDRSLLRCTLHERHPGAHTAGSQMWNDLGEYGRVEQ